MPDISAENARLDLLQQPFFYSRSPRIPSSPQAPFRASTGGFHRSAHRGSRRSCSPRSPHSLRAQAARESAPAKAHFPFIRFPPPQRHSRRPDLPSRETCGGRPHDKVTKSHPKTLSDGFRLTQPPLGPFARVTPRLFSARFRSEIFSSLVCLKRDIMSSNEPEFSRACHS